jgi:hypothetical protein
MVSTKQEIKVSVASLIESLLEDKVYHKTRLFVIVDNGIILKVKELEHILFFEMKELENYEVVRWTTDWNIDRNDDEIRTLIIIGK